MNWTYRLVTANDDPVWQEKSDMRVMPMPAPFNPPNPPPLFPEPQTLGHWYPGVIAMPFFNWVMSTGGTTNPSVPPNCSRAQLFRSNEFQIYDGTSWRGKLTSAEPFDGLTTGQIGTTNFHVSGFAYYPLLHVLYSGHVFASVSQDAGFDANVTPVKDWCTSALLNGMVASPSNPELWSWQTQDPSARLRDFGGSNSTVNLHWANAILRPYEIDAQGNVSKDQVLVIGGHDRHYKTPFNYNALNLGWQLNEPHLSVGPAPTRSWESFGGGNTPKAQAFLNYPRVYGNTVLMPDLSAITFGGCFQDFQPFTGIGGSPPEIQPIPAYTPERFDFLSTSATPVWEQLAPQVSPRLYHSVVVLLKDGRVASLGGYADDIDGMLEHYDLEVFTPQYLRTDVARPLIMSAPTTIPYGGSGITLNVAFADVQVNPASHVDFATLIRCGSVTHHMDWDQRAIKLAVKSASGNTVTFAPLPSTAARGHFLAPPGYYMLFVLRRIEGPQAPQVRVPSVAKFVQVM